MIPSTKTVLPDRNRCDSITAKPCQFSGNTLEPEPDQTNAGALAHVQAMRAAEGAGVPQSWNAALDYVQRSAELGPAAYFIQRRERKASASWPTTQGQIICSRVVEKTERSRDDDGDEREDTIYRPDIRFAYRVDDSNFPRIRHGHEEAPAIG